MCHDCFYTFIGLWMLISGFLFPPWVFNQIVSGAILFGVAAWACIDFGQWLDCAVAVIGAWGIVAEWIFSGKPRIVRANAVASGAFVILASFWPFNFLR
jgi:hypothetical protein